VGLIGFRSRLINRGGLSGELVQRQLDLRSGLSMGAAIGGGLRGRGRQLGPFGLRKWVNLNRAAGQLTVAVVKTAEAKSAKMSPFGRAELGVVHKPVTGIGLAGIAIYDIGWCHLEHRIVANALRIFRGHQTCIREGYQVLTLI